MGTFTDALVGDLPSFLSSGDQLVFNNTKVIPARLKGTRETGGSVEVLLHAPGKDETWWALTRPARKLPMGGKVFIAPNFFFEVVEKGAEGLRRLKPYIQEELTDLLEKYGEMPLPPYIRRTTPQINDKERYQTVYAQHPGAIAAPTAGLHFSKSLLEKVDAAGVSRIYVTLHVGLGTFQSVAVDDIRSHSMHQERCIIDVHAAKEMNSLEKNARRICVGTTSVRTLESMANSQGAIRSGECSTGIFIYPGYQFKTVDALLTNFHLPKSTLLMLVSAFAGYELIREAYAYAIKKQYRFFSYGDAMLIL